VKASGEGYAPVDGHQEKNLESKYFYTGSLLKVLPQRPIKNLESGYYFTLAPCGTDALPQRPIKTYIHRYLLGVYLVLSYAISIGLVRRLRDRIKSLGDMMGIG
jgi:hypothetical protein